MYQVLLPLYFLSILVIQINEKPVAAERISSPDFSLISEYEMERTIQVEHHVRGNNVYLECVIPNFTFKQSGGLKQDGEGHLNVIIDGTRTEKVSTAAFIIHGLSSGEHTLKIQVVHNDFTKYPLEHTINVQIP
ncbi:hypothetical protein [Bacillus sp. REN16]|uniref:hypothetical protein n=1 Tax=Bacillus sp. REN16 TaxID=2887296 RepID=UPI001E2A4301|nr:hypothetical protein [Bacillus sp. REN16]MCC3357594.1 hypothetical protein [Bacillus sp. REN16]